MLVIIIIDLKPTATTNHMVKYGDEASLLVPQNHNVILEDEFKNIKQWAKIYKLTINLSKTKELVYHRPNFRLFIPPQLLIILSESSLQNSLVCLTWER